MFRFAQDTGLIRAERQSNEAFTCQVEGNNTDCLPAEVTSAPTSLVNCLQGNELVNDITSRVVLGAYVTKMYSVNDLHVCVKTAKNLISIIDMGLSSLIVLKFMK